MSADARLAATWAHLNTSGHFIGTNVQVWDVTRSNIVHELPAHPSIFAAFSPNNESLVVGDEVEYRAWDLRTWQSRYALPRDVAGFWAYMAFSRDGRMLAVAISRSTVRLVQAATGSELATLEAPDRMDIHWITFNADGTQLAVVTGAGPIQLWDLRLIRQQLATMKLDWEMPPFPPPQASEKLKLPASLIVNDTDEPDAALSQLYCRRAKSHERVGHYDQAVAAYRRAIDLNPDLAVAYNSLAWAYATWPARFRSAEKALPLAIKAVELANRGHNEMNTLGVVYYRLGRLTNAVDTLEEGFKARNEAGNADDFFFLSMAYHRLGDPDKARDFFMKANEWVTSHPGLSPTERAEK
ncbi:MAG TPA: tetratricopeptide repeat protein, partial [Candidatus Eisenbacteria bacterium]|nr:tetratricopeptide repeat protein [Candidatus Eisenbacteria bacterium]